MRREAFKKPIDLKSNYSINEINETSEINDDLWA
jgi:hypothetical protein